MYNCFVLRLEPFTQVSIRVAIFEYVRRIKAEAETPKIDKFLLDIVY